MGSLEVLHEDVGTLLLVDEDDHGRLEATRVEDLDETGPAENVWVRTRDRRKGERAGHALLLLLARDELDALVDPVDGLSSDSDSDNRRSSEVLLREALDGRGHGGGEHHLRSELGQRERLTR